MRRVVDYVRHNQIGKYKEQTFIIRVSQLKGQISNAEDPRIEHLDIPSFEEINSILLQEMGNYRIEPPKNEGSEDEK